LTFRGRLGQPWRIASVRRRRAAWWRSPAESSTMRGMMESGTTHDGGLTMTRASGPTAVRVAAKAVIVRDGRLLTVKSKDLLHPERFYYSLPGGGQQPGENLLDAMRRECLEEV